MVKSLNENLQELLDDRVYDFVQHLKVDAYAEFGEYKGFVANRKVLFREDKEYDSPDHFWDVAKIHFKELPVVGKNLSKIPGNFPKIDLPFFYEASKKYSSNTDTYLIYDFNVMLKNIRL